MNITKSHVIYVSVYMKEAVYLTSRADNVGPTISTRSTQSRQVMQVYGCSTREEHSSTTP